MNNSMYVHERESSASSFMKGTLLSITERIAEAVAGPTPRYYINIKIYLTVNTSGFVIASIACL